MKITSKKIGIVGAGGWGTAIAKLLAENHHHVRIWSYEKSVAGEINKSHLNSRFLKGVALPHSIEACSELNELDECELYVLATPTQYLRNVLKNINPDNKNKLFINVAKGIEKNTLMRISEIVSDTLDISKEQYILLTGPSHAEEVGRMMPTTVVIASFNHSNDQYIQKLFTTSYFRVYSTDDVIGCEIGGSLKNVIAIAAGVIDGLKLGDNTKAALITRGLAEMSRLGVALGANPFTFSGLSGLGDLFVTCNSKYSRNRFVGEQVGSGRTLNDVLNEMNMVAEGIHTTESAYHLGKKHNVEMPITEQMYSILFKDIQPMAAIESLMTRQSKREWWW